MAVTSGGITLRELAGRSIGELSSVGPKLEERLAVMGIQSVLDVLQHYPRRWIDRTKKVDIAALAVNEQATVVAEVRTVKSWRAKRGGPIVDVVVSDGTSVLNIRFFNQAWRAKQLTEGTEASFWGKLEVFRGKRQMTNPVVDVIGRAGESDDKTGVIVPVYPQSGKAEVYTWQLRKIVSEALRRSRERGLADPLDDTYGYVDRTTAYHDIHRSDSMKEQRAAADRLIFDEFLRMQVGLVARKRALAAEESGIQHVADAPLKDAFIAQLPFGLTGDQQQAIGEIAHDMAAAAPMHRLLQGDVGSGKTVVALAALLIAVQGGYQGAFMAPTEVLAEQHYLGSLRMLDGLRVSSESSLFADRPVTVALLTNRTPAAERRKIVAGLEANEIDILVGTHALLYGDAQFTRLGLAVIDEQHRFGVEQRALLRGKGDQPDVLVMTATPIPRTAAMLVYGDLDRSELREMPPGRTPIVTTLVPPNPLDHASAWERLRAEVEAGHQAYVVCPLVDDRGKVEAKAATAEFERLQAEELEGLRVALLHGQMKSADKEPVMTAFRAGEIDVLVATTVIEVGVDVPNATVMVVEDADRFGLSQLHQLRGRVGRGAAQSWCFLFGDPATEDGEERLKAMAASNDGFDLAEKDLEIRGSGEVFGEKQSGMNDLKLGRIPRDEAVVIEARRAAELILDDDPDLGRHQQLREEVEDLLGDDVEFLFKS